MLTPELATLTGLTIVYVQSPIESFNFFSTLSGLIVHYKVRVVTQQGLAPQLDKRDDPDVSAALTST